MGLTKEEEAVARQLEQLELVSKAREAEEFLERVEEVHATVKGLIDGTVDAAELEKQQQREVWRKRAKEMRKEEVAARARKELHMGRAGKGEGKRPYTYFCRFCLVEYEIEDLRCCNRCGRELQTRAQRLAELQQRVQTLKEEKHQHASRKARWRRWLQTKKILKSSRLVVDYAAWERWEPSSDEEEKQNEPPVTPADDENFHALERDLQASACSRAGRRTLALRCKEKGNRLFKNRDWLGALQAYEEGLEKSRDLKELWTNKSLVLLKMQRYEEAHEAATRLLEYCEIFEDGYTQSPDACFKALSRRALANRALRRFDDALADLEHATELNPKDKQAQQLLQQTQLQVDQLHHLEQLRRVAEGNNTKERELQPNDDDAIRTQDLNGNIQEREDHLKLPDEAQEKNALMQPAATLYPTAEADALKTSEAAEAETLAPVSAVADPVSSAATGRAAAPYKAVEALAPETNFTGKTQKTKIEHHVCKGESDAASPRDATDNISSQIEDQSVRHAGGSNQITSGATPVSPSPSSHARNEEVHEAEQLFSDAVHSLVSSSSPQHVTGPVEKRAAIAAQTPGPFTTATAGVSRGPLPPAHTTAAASSTTADTSSGSSSPGLHGSRPSTKTSNDMQTAGLSSSCSTVSTFSAGPTTATNNATEALNEMQRLLHPAAAAGSFAALAPPNLSAALKLLNFSHVKLSFCCSSLTQVAAGRTPSSRDNMSSTAGRSSETGHRNQGVSSSGHKQSRREQEEICGREAQATAYNVQKTFLDICVADLRSAALIVRRQRRERAEFETAAVHTSSFEKTVVAQEEAGSEKCDKESPSSLSTTQTAFDLYPHACFPALQLLHSVCFLERSSDASTNYENSFTVAHNSRHGRLTDTKADSTATTRADQINRHKNDSSTETAGTPPWLLEVCEAAAPYLLTLTSELLQLFMPYNPSEVLDIRTATTATATAGTTTAGPAEEMLFNYCGCHSGYKIVPHADYHTRRGSCRVSGPATADCQAENNKLPDEGPPCCAWGACAVALATSMSLLQQLSVAPLTRRKLAEHLQRSNDGRAVLFEIPVLLLCCPYEASSVTTDSWPSWKEDLAASAAEERASPSCRLDTMGVSHAKQPKDARQGLVKDKCERRLQQARRDAGALLCNVLLEQPVLHHLLQQRQPGKIPSEEPRQQGRWSKMPQQLRSLLSKRLQALLQRDKFLQEAEEAAATLSEQMEPGQLSQQLLPLLRKQAALMQQEERGSSRQSRRIPHDKNLPRVSNTGSSLSNRPSPLHSRNTSPCRNTYKSHAAEGHTSSNQPRKSAVATHTEKLINTLLLSTKEVEALEAHASVRPSTINAEEDPLLEEAQQALDIMTNMARSPAGRVFVLTHLKEEVLLLLAASSTSAVEEHGSTSTKQHSHTLSILDKAQQKKSPQMQQSNAAGLLRKLLMPSQSSRNYNCRLLKAVDVLGLLMNLTVSSGVSVASSRSSLSVQPQRQQGTSSCAEILTSLQHQFLLSGGTQFGLLPLLLSHIDKLIVEQQKRLPPAPGAAVVAAAHAPSAEEMGQLVTAGLRSITVISRLIAAATTATAPGSPANVSFVVQGRAATETQELNKNLKVVPALQQSLTCTAAAAATQQRHVSAVAAWEQTEQIQSLTRYRGLVVCLLPRILQLLTPPNNQRKWLRQKDLSKQQRLPSLQEQMSAEKDCATWTEVHNASLLMLCALANMNMTCLLEIAATTPTATFDAFNHSTAAPPAKRMNSYGSSTIVKPQQGEVEQRERQPSQQQQNKDPAHSRSSALQEIGRVICGWLQVLKPTDYAHERTEMRDPVAMARGNFLLLVGHIAKAQSVAMQQQLTNQQHQKHAEHFEAACERYPQRGIEQQQPSLQQQPQQQASQQQPSQQKPSTQPQTDQEAAWAEGSKEAEGQAAGDAAAATREALAADVLKDPAAPAAELLQRELEELDLRLCIHCCVESLRKDVEGPQKNAAIALAALARITKYRPHIDALNGFESLMQIAAPKLLRRR